MLKKYINIKNALLSFMALIQIASLSSFAYAALQPQLVSAQTKQAVCEGVGLTGGTDGCEEPGDGPNVSSVIKTIIQLFSIVVGVVAVIMIMIGGFKYITSGGDSNSTASAKNTILYALVGLVVVALAQVIVRFVLNKL